MIKSALIGAMVGSIVGMGVCISRNYEIPSPEEDSYIDLMHLKVHAEALSICDDIQVIKYLFHKEFILLTTNIDKLLSVQSQAREVSDRPRFSLIASGQFYRTKIVDLLRVLSDNLKDEVYKSLMPAFTNLQKLVDDVLFNITMEVQSQLDR